MLPMPRASLETEHEPEAGSATGGLTTAEAHRRLAEFGPNQLVPEERRPSFLSWLVRPLADPMVVLLLASGATYLLLADYFDAGIILIAVIAISAVTQSTCERAARRVDAIAARGSGACLRAKAV